MHIVFSPMSYYKSETLTFVCMMDTFEKNMQDYFK